MKRRSRAISRACSLLLPRSAMGSLPGGEDRIDHALDGADKIVESMLVAPVLDAGAGMGNRGAITPETLGNVGEGQSQRDMADIHGDLLDMAAGEALVAGEPG